MKTQDYVTVQELSVSVGHGKTELLPENSFVKLIQDNYLPRHVKSSDIYRLYSGESKFYYCRFGIVPINPKYIRKI